MTLIQYPKSVQPSLLTVLKRMVWFNDADAEHGLLYKEQM